MVSCPVNTEQLYHTKPNTKLSLKFGITDTELSISRSIHDNFGDTFLDDPPPTDTKIMDKEMCGFSPFKTSEGGLSCVVFRTALYC